MQTKIKEYLNSDDLQLNGIGTFYLSRYSNINNDEYEVLAWFASNLRSYELYNFLYTQGKSANWINSIAYKKKSDLKALN